MGLIIFIACIYLFFLMLGSGSGGRSGSGSRRGSGRSGGGGGRSGGGGRRR